MTDINKTTLVILRMIRTVIIEGRTSHQPYNEGVRSETEWYEQLSFNVALGQV